MPALSHQINSIRQSQGLPEAVICIVSTLDAHHANYQLSLTSPAPGATNVRQAPKGLLLQQRLGPQAATKQRTKIQKSSDAFHDSALYRHWFKIHTASPGPTFSCRLGYPLTCMAPCKGRQRKFIISGMIFVHSPVVQLQTDDKNFDRSLMVTMVSFGFLFVMSEPQLPVPRPQPHGLSHAKLLSTRH